MSDELSVDGADFIAVIGMSCRFPEAPDVETFWRNLHRGVESVSEFSEEELAALPEALRTDENYVKVSAPLTDLDQFDAAFFGLTPREAAAMDPQQRFFLEVGWEALERAGYPPAGAAAGVFAGAYPSGYLTDVLSDPAMRETMGVMQLSIGNDKDHLAPRLSYLLNLRGPSVSVQTACSASLVSVHLACQSLLNHECDLALAGGSSIAYPQRSGHFYEEGGVISPDGRCRAFDARSRGSAMGSGVALVVLKRLEEALEDGDQIHAVIRGAAINNDGAAKVGYTAPSVEGQRRVIEEAIAVAGLEPEEISFVEAHGTGTTLGDPIEVEALRQAFGYGDGAQRDKAPEQTCALGSVKTNIGHCNTAAGVAGLIKAILCLENKTLVPSLHFEQPNPQIDFTQTPFFVNTETRPWEQSPRYAGVSSFGIGGTNAHVVLEEGPQVSASGPSRPHQLFTLSARSATALGAVKKRLHAFLEDHPTAQLSDVAFTLNAGRQGLSHRHSMVCRDRQELMANLAQEMEAASSETAQPVPEGRPKVVFMFPGHGAGSEKLGQSLYHREPAYRAAADRCLEILTPLLEVDLRPILFPADEQGDDKLRELTRPALWQPAVFLTEYALAHLWMSWGVVPTAMVGHSLGEIVAAALAEVFTLEDALRLVAERGRRTEELPTGAMLAVPVSEEEIASHLQGALSLAAVNGPELVVVSGPVDEIETLAEKLAPSSPIRLTPRRAFHSEMVEPMLAPIAELVQGFRLSAPKIPYLSNVTGTWMSAEDATDPHYWARHLRQPVRFHDALVELRRQPERLFLEVGPGKVLTGLTNRGVDTQLAVASLPGDDVAERAVLTAAGALWQRGAEIDWQGFYAEEDRRRLTLPTYPFERQSYWFEGEGAPSPMAMSDSLTVKKPPQDWFFLPTWQLAPRVRSVRLEEHLDAGGDWLIFTDRESGLGKTLHRRLKELGQRVVLAYAGEGFDDAGEDAFVLDPAKTGDYDSLLTTLVAREQTPQRVLFAWSASLAAEGQAQNTPALGLESLIRLVQALGSLQGAPEVHLAVVTQGVEPVLDGERERTAAAQAALQGVVQVVPKEFAQLSCQSLDVDPAADALPVVEALLGDVVLDAEQERVAFRQGRRWLPVVEPFPMAEEEPSPFRQGGVYLVTHGLQEIGLALAERLTQEVGATVILVDRSFFPAPSEWESWIASEGEDDFLSRKIARLLSLREALDGSSQEGSPSDLLHVRTADPADVDRLRQVKEEVEHEFGAIHGVFHLDPPQPFTGLIAGKPGQQPVVQVAARMREVQHLEALFGDELSFLVLFSANAAESGGLGQVDQAATCAFVERFAHHLSAVGRRTLAIAWGTRKWLEEDETPPGESFLEQQLELKRENFGMTPEECLDTLERALHLALPQVIISTRDFDALMEQQSQFTAEFFQQQMSGAGTAESSWGEGEVAERPDLDTPFEEPRSEVEKLLAEDWKLFFGLREIGIHDGFFELGGHSLLAVQILKKVNETFSTQLDLQEFFDGPTIAGLAERVAGSSVDADEAELAALLSEVEGLSDEELEQLLGPGEGSDDSAAGGNLEGTPHV